MSSPPPSSASRDELLAALALAGREFSNAAVMFHTAVAARLGLGATDEKILDLLEREGPVTAGDLVARTGLKPSSITAALDRLEPKGFLRRRRDPADQRRVVVELRHERLAEALPLFEGLGRRLAELYDGYEDDELALILDYLRRAADLQRAATTELSTGEGTATEGGGAT